ncbi:STAS domain-containing protein [Sulfuricurvum sp.]|uniref:STAS domain-containing protein n=1 Tax=Sulfuricurvum sp. TaxID=2025608 RepID=UPI003BB80EB3
MKLLSQKLTISEVNEAQNLLVNTLSSWDITETLDLSEITSIDMCGIQLLLSFQKSLQLLGYTLTLTGLSTSLISAIVLSGCAELLGVEHE